LDGLISVGNHVNVEVPVDVNGLDPILRNALGLAVVVIPRHFVPERSTGRRRIT
jgi:hypothetical protein